MICTKLIISYLTMHYKNPCKKYTKHLNKYYIQNLKPISQYYLFKLTYTNFSSIISKFRFR